MYISDNVLAKLQKLGMITIQPQKCEEIKVQLGEILGFVENLKNLELENITSATTLKTPLRDDVVVDSRIASYILDSAPKAQEGFFVVPKIIE